MTTILTINRKKFFQVVSPQFLENFGFFLSLFIYFNFFVTGCFSQVSMVGNRGKNYLNIFYALRNHTDQGYHPPMLTTVSKEIKAPSSKVKSNFFFSPLQRYSGTSLNRTPLGPEEMSGLEGCAVYWCFTHRAILCRTLYCLTVSTSTWYTSTSKAHQ